MSKLNEYIIAVFFVSLLMFVTYNVAYSQELKCYPNKDFMKIIDDQGFVTLYNGFTPDKKINEVMMSKDRYLYVIQYTPGSDGNALQAKEYCITGILNNVTFNDTSIEFLYGMLEKMKGQKT